MNKALGITEQDLSDILKQAKFAQQKAFYDELKSLGSNEGFGQLPRGLFEITEYQCLTECKYKVLNTFYMFRNNLTAISKPGYKNVIKYLRLWKPSFSLSTLKRTVRELEREGFMYRLRDACRGYATPFFMPENAKQRNLILERIESN